MRPRFYQAVIGGLFLACALVGCGSSRTLHEADGAHRPKSLDQARFARKVDWATRGVWLKADTHMHSTFSDGRHTIDELAATAVKNGCDVIAITDHADASRTAATPAYFEAIQSARRKYPRLIILAGLEWNIPPFGGAEHATVLVDTGPNADAILTTFKQRFDDRGRHTHKAELARDALRWLADAGRRQAVPPVVIYNHPSRKTHGPAQIVQSMRDWRAVNDIVIGFSGAPGHQGRRPLGGYRDNRKPVDRWDPAAASQGDAWDMLLRDGHDVWAARAPSDFHNADSDENRDFWPGQFSETWLYAPERTAGGALRALRAGSFFGVHGHIAREVELTVQARGLQRPAVAGEIITAPVGVELAVTVRFVAASTDWSGEPSRIDVVEIIAVTDKAARIIAASPPHKTTDGHDVSSALLSVPSGGVVLRARGRRIIPDGPDLLFYTNPIRARTPK